MPAPQIIALLLAVLVLGAIPLLLLIRLGMLRVPPVMRGEIRMKDIALSREAWPEKTQQFSNAFDNQFQLPVLFYVAVFMTLFLGVGWIEVALAWSFVLARVVHVVIHITDNHVIRRFLAYTAGYVALSLLWLAMAVRWVMAVL